MDSVTSLRSLLATVLPLTENLSSFAREKEADLSSPAVTALLYWRMGCGVGSSSIVLSDTSLNLGLLKRLNSDVLN